MFVMGCHRSGTNLLYDTLLSAGGFAVYRGYIPAYKMLGPKFGGFADESGRKRIIAAFIQSKGFRRSGLDAALLTLRLREECRTAGDFVRITMEEVARSQRALRWAAYDPDNVLYLPKIKADIPDALFIHIIRDGRDIAVSLQRMGGFQPLPWDRSARSLEAIALYWEWMVRKGHEHGRAIPADYVEIRYEELVSHPRQALTVLSRFLDQELDYERIQRAGLGSLRQPNSSFGVEPDGAKESPVNRWRQKLSRQQVANIEALVGDCLTEFGYELSIPEAERRPGLRETWMGFVYRNFLDAKLSLKTRTPLGRLTDTSSLELTDSTPDGGTAA